MEDNDGKSVILTPNRIGEKLNPEQWPVAMEMGWFPLGGE